MFSIQVVFIEPEVQDLTLIQWIFLAVAITFIVLFIIVVIAFVTTRKE